jgi:hypothetical protein
MDLAVHLAGAQFGANFYNSDWSRIKIDDILTSIRSKSQAVKVLSKAQALNLVKFNPNKFYNQWIKLMGIEEVFLSTYKQIKNK